MAARSFALSENSSQVNSIPKPFIFWILIVSRRILIRCTDFTNSVSARLISVEVLKKYLEERVFPKLGKRKFAVLYMHTGVQRSENFPGISGLRSIYDAIPANVKENLEAFYFIHPGLQARLFLATVGRFLFNAGYAYAPSSFANYLINSLLIFIIIQIIHRSIFIINNTSRMLHASLTILIYSLLFPFLSIENLGTMQLLVFY